MGRAAAVEITVTDHEADLASGLLWAAGVSAVAELPEPAGGMVLRADVPPGGLAAVAEAIGGRWDVVGVEVDDGLDGWRAHARAVRVGSLVVRPPWVEVEPGLGRDATVIDIDPGHAFGHGAHPTTSLCLEMLEEAVAAGAITVLDVGCGSGVLAIGALVLGAERAVGVDIDPAAVEASIDNARRNGVAERLTAGSAPASGLFDLVVANIGAATLRSLASALVESVAPSGMLVVSGLLDPPPADMASAFAPLVLADDRRRDGWTALSFRHPVADAAVEPRVEPEP